jgi:hypothetical protein
MLGRSSGNTLTPPAASAVTNSLRQATSYAYLRRIPMAYPFFYSGFCFLPKKNSIAQNCRVIALRPYTCNHFIENGLAVTNSTTKS